MPLIEFTSYGLVCDDCDATFEGADPDDTIAQVLDKAIDSDWSIASPVPFEQINHVDDLDEVLCPNCKDATESAADQGSPDQGPDQ